MHMLHNIITISDPPPKNSPKWSFLQNTNVREFELRSIIPYCYRMLLCAAELQWTQQESSWQGVPDFLYEVVPAKQLLEIVLTWTNG